MDPIEGREADFRLILDQLGHVLSGGNLELSGSINQLAEGAIVCLHDSLVQYKLFFYVLKEISSLAARYQSLQDYSIPEILRVPLEELCLHIMVSNHGNLFQTKCVLRAVLVKSI